MTVSILGIAVWMDLSLKSISVKFSFTFKSYVFLGDGVRVLLEKSAHFEAHGFVCTFTFFITVPCRILLRFIPLMRKFNNCTPTVPCNILQAWSILMQVKFV